MELSAANLRSGAEITAIIAPAGYGKTRLAEAMASKTDVRSRANCASSIGQLVRNILDGLASETDAGSSLVTEARALYTGHDDDALVALALQVWSREPSSTATFVIDNVEQALPDRACVNLLGELLARRPLRRRVILCSRNPLPSALSRYLQPHRSAILGVRDLRLSETRVRELIGRRIDDQRLLDQYTRLVDGWPIAALLIAQWPSDCANPTLTETQEALVQYLCSEYLESLNPGQLSVVLAATALPRTTTTELAASCNLAPHQIEAFIAENPFLSVRDRDIVEAHGLIEAATKSRFLHERDAARMHARASAIDRGDVIRAAEIDLYLGEVESAATRLSELDLAISKENLARVVAILGELNLTTILAQPRLWATTFELRRASLPISESIAEARRVLAGLPMRSAITLRFEIIRHLVFSLALGGRLDDALGELSSLRSTAGDSEIESRVELMQAALNSLRGGYAKARSVFLTSAMDYPNLAIKYLDFIDGTWAFRSGDYDTGVAKLQEAIRLERKFGWISNLLVSLGNLAWESWLVADDKLFHESVAELQASLLDGHEPAWHFWLSAASGKEVAQTGYEPVAIRAIGYLFLAGASDGADRVRFARRATVEAEASNDVALRIISLFYCAEFDVTTRRESLAMLLALSANIDLPPMREAISAYVAGTNDLGALNRFVERRLRSSTSLEHETTIHLTRASASKNDVSIDLSPMEFGLLAYLATARRVPSRESICDALWPEADGDAAAVNLKVVIHRVRRKLGSQSIIRVSHGYSIGPRVRVDLVDAEHLVRAVHQRNEVSVAEHAELSRHLIFIEGARHETLSRYSWYGGIESRIHDLQRSMETALQLPFTSHPSL